MTTIEGVGGEVIQFFIILAVILICFLLWLSTRVRNPDEAFFSTVYVLERQYDRNLENHNQILSITEHSNEGEHADLLTAESTSNRPTVTIKQDTSGESLTESDGNIEILADKTNVTPSCSNTNEIRKRCLPTCTKTSLESEMKSECECSQETRPNQTELNIKIRLKYLNDDSREVEGFLCEKLSDFKGRNFSEEIAANKLIRLIFNGRVLRDDNLSLQNHGLFNDCVVHCLIINEKPQQTGNSEQQEPSQHFSQNNDQTTVPEWNLSKLLCFIVVGILSLTWYCRFQFAALFTFTSTSFLFGLTIIFLCSMFGTFYVDSVSVN